MEKGKVIVLKMCLQAVSLPALNSIPSRLLVIAYFKLSLVFSIPIFTRGTLHEHLVHNLKVTYSFWAKFLTFNFFTKACWRQVSQNVCRWRRLAFTSMTTKPSTFIGMQSNKQPTSNIKSHFGIRKYRYSKRYETTEWVRRTDEHYAGHWSF